MGKPVPIDHGSCEQIKRSGGQESLRGPSIVAPHRHRGWASHFGPEVVVAPASEALCGGRRPRVLVPPKKNAQVKPEVAALKERNRNIRSRARIGKREWHTRSGYSRRSIVENAAYRYKGIIGPTMRSRTLQGQRVEARVGCRILNTIAGLGMPESHQVD